MALNDVLDMLRNEIPLPEKYRQHALQGNYTEYLECHIDGDFLLIWYDEVNNTIALFRLGSHSELFKK
ncbi:MAG: type II toxin-antitoxin system YafQ family toxin [Muribaculaceae bacterium]|nr:type II toxin-antitoxin system YafQ family toxin [Muribaculaceae bacterium]